ncbi:MAG: hypothetical protein U9R68_01010 [Planctomycetota bacterium]|nr:hypothetical protein [Planctomycetota bacterium]
MRVYHRTLGACGLAVVGLLVAAGAGRACSVPVYRYALERWRVDPYEIHVFHRGDLAEGHKQALERLRDASVEERPDGVIDLWLTDLSKGEPEGEAAKVWQEHASAAKTPWLVVRYPRVFGIPIDTWAGPLSPEAVSGLLDSPTRRQVAKRLLEGETAVFVFLESGDAKKDEAAVQRLAKDLKRMEELIEPPIPPGGVWGDPIYDTEGVPELKIAFSIVRLTRDDPGERAFREMLLGCEPGLKQESGPMAFPIFGRGRVLCALVGEGISKLNIEEVCGFVASPCSCIVKYQNPGVDMLMDVRWDAALMGEASAIPEVVPPPLTGLAKFAKAAEAEAQAARPETTEADAGAAPSDTAERPVAAKSVLDVMVADTIRLGTLLVWSGLVLAALLGLTVVSIVIWKRGRRTQA